DGELCLRFDDNGGTDPDWVLNTVFLRFLGPDTDFDKDGLPNAWEERFFGGATNAVAGADTDGDGLTEYEEYVAGTIPTNALSRFDIRSVYLGPDGLVIRWPTFPERVYDVLYTTNLAVPFSVIGANLVHPQNAWTNPQPIEPLGFYRVRVRLP
ncbi:MAG: hypothetical protein D6766_14645, partial [Verrucomicrobia bacterium]